MPRRKQPKSLQKLSMHCLISTILTLCQQSDGKDVKHIRKKVHEIPPLFAIEYVHDLLMIASRDFRHCDKVKLRGAFHLSCKEIDLEDAIFTLSPHVLDEILDNLESLRNLTVLKPGLPYLLSGSKKIYANMPNLRCFHASSRLHPATVSAIFQNCPRLEEISLWCMSNKQLMSLPFQCNNLKKLELRPDEFWLPKTVVMNLLKNLPKLESVCIYEIPRVLELCTDVYPLKDFISHFIPRDSMMLKKLAHHFPELQHLSLQLPYRNQDVDLEPVKELVKLENLQVSHMSATRLICLIDGCFSRLTTLGFEEVTDLDCLFKRDMRLNLPLVTSLKIHHSSLVDLAAIGEIFSNLKVMDLDGNMYSGLPTDLSGGLFKKLTCLEASSLPMSHMRYIMHSCHELNTLHMFDDTCDKSDFLDLLQTPSLQEVHTLTLKSNKITDALVFFESLGARNLCKLTIRSDCLHMSDSARLALEKELHKYSMNLYIEDFFYRPLVFEYEGQ